jgi:hypothetical protein
MWVVTQDRQLVNLAQAWLVRAVERTNGSVPVIAQFATDFHIDLANVDSTELAECLTVSIQELLASNQMDVLDVDQALIDLVNPPGYFA